MLRDPVKRPVRHNVCFVTGDDGDERTESLRLRFEPRSSMTSHWSFSSAHISQLARVTPTSQDTPGEACVGRTARLRVPEERGSVCFRATGPVLTVSLTPLTRGGTYVLLG